MRAKPLILVVDDEHNFLEIMSAKLNASGFDAVIAKNGKEALAKVKELKPDLVLMDIHMPDETGTDLALSIKQNPETRDVKIAFLTSLKEPWPAVSGGKEQVAKELGMDDFLEKSEDLDVLMKKVRDILGIGAVPAA